MNWNLKFTTQNEQLLFIGLCVLAGLLLLAFIRIILLLRQRRKQDERAEKLEKQILDQQKHILDVRSDANGWRGEMQRQFDGFRSDATRRYGEAELRTQELQKRLDTATEQNERRVFELQAALDAARRMCAELPNAKARIMDLERMLGEESEPVTNGAHSMDEGEMLSLAAAAKSVSSTSLPMLPSMETLQTQPTTAGADGAEVDSLALLQQRNAELERSLLLARRRKPATRAKTPRPR